MKRRCSQCGQCCVNNGLIPPPADSPHGPKWIEVIGNSLRRLQGRILEIHQLDIATASACVFLTEDKRCAIHGVKPSFCKDFACENTPAGATEEKHAATPESVGAAGSEE